MPALPTGYTGTALLGQDDPAASSGEDHGNSEEMGAALGKGETRNKRSSGRGGGALLEKGSQMCSQNSNRALKSERKPRQLVVQCIG